MGERVGEVKCIFYVIVVEDHLTLGLRILLLHLVLVDALDIKVIVSCIAHASHAKVVFPCGSADAEKAPATHAGTGGGTFHHVCLRASRRQ